MSLKAFHIVFITVSTLLAFGFAGWALWTYFNQSRSTTDLVLGVGGVLAGIALLWYGKYFLRKLKKISYL